MTYRQQVQMLCMGVSSIFCTWLYLRRKRGVVAVASENEFSSDSKPLADASCSCVIKLGGSACTQKDAFETFNFEEVSRFSEQLSDICLSESGFRPIVLHGAGSFGHYQAKQYSVGSGTRKASGVGGSSMERISVFLREGFAQTRLSVTRLNHHVVTTMVQKGLGAVGVSPFPLVPVDRRRLPGVVPGWPWESALARSIGEVLSLGLVPVLHGDACVDISGQATSILSGDTLFVHLCSVFRPTHAVFLADVDGVLTSPPPNGTVIRQILVKGDGSWHNSSIETSTRNHDVTGGIKHKIDAAVQVVTALRIPVFIVKAGSTDAKLCIRGQRPLVGTTVEFDQNQ